MNGAEQVISDTEDIIDKIGDSVLSLNQKMHAIKTFTTPKLDYILIFILLSEFKSHYFITYFFFKKKKKKKKIALLIFFRELLTVCKRN